ncbi:Exosome complex component rrp43 AltName: Full=Ribosomal RNA-processing protein 43 [Serendipita indica DSM 11827]|nr:Exosome complex component rrp43 AltName: Full=Ribosomal RNA-processing protein 43 [Serendipita indica DSM 11827]
MPVTDGSISTADGSALVRLGETTIVCGVKAEIAEPDLDAPTRGFIVPNVEISAICAARFKPGPPSEEAQIISEQLNQIIAKSKCLPLDSLCIEPRKAVWTIYIDAVCINYDGNALDATLLAMTTALSNTQLPQARYDDDKKMVLCSRMNKTPLALKTLPTATTFGIFESKHLLVDPTSFEEPLLESTVTVVLCGSEAISVSQVGLGRETSPSGQSSTSLYTECIELAQKRQAEILRAVSQTNL